MTQTLLETEPQMDTPSDTFAPGARRLDEKTGEVTTPSAFPMVDGWVNQNVAGRADDAGIHKLFPELAARRARGTTTDQLVEEMDAAGISRAMLCTGYGGHDNLDWALDAVQRHPARFAVSLMVDPRQGMAAVRALESGVRGNGVRMARVMALETQMPYDHAVYFPIYAKCVELGIPIGVNVGFPGPLVPGRHQDPISLDYVCAFFPELVVVMSHGGEPWTEVCVKLMTKWPNLYYMSSAFAPRRIPTCVVDFMNGRGADRVMWASDYPLLTFDRCRREIAEMPLRDEERRRKFMHDNATRVLFGEDPVTALGAQKEERV